jgi:hypothetical protein
MAINTRLPQFQQPEIAILGKRASPPSKTASELRHSIIQYSLMSNDTGGIAEHEHALRLAGLLDMLTLTSMLP